MIDASTCIWYFSFTGCFCLHIFELYLFFTSLSKEGDYPSNISFQINSAPCLFIGDGHPAEGGHVNSVYLIFLPLMETNTLWSET